VPGSAATDFSNLMRVSGARANHVWIAVTIEPRTLRARPWHPGAGGHRDAALRRASRDPAGDSDNATTMAAMVLIM